MVQEEQNQRCSTSSSGGKSSKKTKQTKIPQRGLGVEKLERIRLEEQRKINETPTRPVPVVLPLHHHHHHQQQQNSSISVSHLDLFSPPIPLPHINSSAHYVSNNLINTTFGNTSSESSMASWPGPAMVDGFNCVPELTHDLERKRVVSEFTIGLNSLNAQRDFKPNWACSVPVPRKQQPQQVSSLMNVCASSVSPSSGLNLQMMEPPSNQSCYSNYYGPTFWPEEEKMVGMKRPWPFSLDNPPGPSYKFHQMMPTLFKPGESSSFEHKSIGSLGSFDSLREVHNMSSPCSFKWSTKMEMNQSKIVEEYGPLDGNSLSLGLSTTVSPSTTSKSKQPLLFPAAHYHQLNGLTYQVGIEDPLINPGSLVQDRRLYSFFPLKTPQIGLGISNERGDEAENDVDLTLKL